jgi:ATP-dependent DNA helicase 2 subunit 2
MLSRADSLEIIHDAVKQMTSIIETQIKHSLGDANYDRVVEGLGTLREELVDYEEPTLYNDYLGALKGKILGEELGGDRKELWWLIRKSKLGLIDQVTSEVSKVTEDEAKEVSSKQHDLRVLRSTANFVYSSSLPPEQSIVIHRFALMFAAFLAGTTMT